MIMGNSQSICGNILLDEYGDATIFGSLNGEINIPAVNIDVAGTISKCAETVLSTAGVGAAIYLGITESKNIFDYICSKFKHKEEKGD